MCKTVLKSPKLLFSLINPGKCTISCFGGAFSRFPTFLYASIFGLAAAAAFDALVWKVRVPMFNDGAADLTVTGVVRRGKVPKQVLSIEKLCGWLELRGMGYVTRYADAVICTSLDITHRVSARCGVEV